MKDSKIKCDFTLAKEISDLVLTKDSSVTFKDVDVLKKLVKSLSPDFVKKRSVGIDLKNLVNRFAEGDLKKAKFHTEKFKNKTKIYANDMPFSVGDKVLVMRSEHGYNSGNKAVVVCAEKDSGGIWRYVVNVLDDRGVSIPDYLMDIRHTRDLYPY